jgi:predicted ATPase
VDANGPAPMLELYPGIEKLRRELDLVVSGDTLAESVALAESRRRALIEAATQLVGNVTRQGPVVLCCEDVHWADPTTREWLAHLERWATDKPLLLLVTARDATGIGSLGSANAAQIVLTGLSSEVLGQIVAFHWPASKPLPPKVLDHVRAYSDGVPLFAEEITKLLARTAADPGARLVEELISLRDMLKARIEQSGADGHVVRAASVLGRSFRLRVLRRMLKGQVAMTRVDNSLRCLQEAGLLQEGRKGLGLQHRFNHLLIQESVYSSLLEEDRANLHRLALRALQEASDNLSDRVPDAVLADHATRGGLISDALVFLERAGDEALRRGGLREARGHFERAIEVMKSGDGRPLPVPQDSELSIRMKLGALMTALDGPGAVETRKGGLIGSGRCLLNPETS